MRVLLLGAGRIGSVHATHLAADSRVGRLLVCESHEGRRNAIVRVLGRATVAVGDLDHALAAGVDAAVVATPSELHFEQVSALLAAGVPTFCEKPLALNVAEARELGARAGAVPLVVGFQRRFDEAYRRLAETCAEARERGDPPTLYRLTSGDRTPPPIEFLERAGSLFHDMLIHDFDVLGFVCPAAPLGVTGAGSHAGLPDGAPGWGTATAVCRLDDGAIAVICGTRETGSGYEVSAQVTSRSGLIAIGTASAGSPARLLDAPAGSRQRPHADFIERFRDAFRRELVAFIDVVSGEPRSLPGVPEMVRALSLADAAADSAESAFESRHFHRARHPERVGLDGQRRVDATGERHG